jgi:hypothetical protein
MKTNYLRILCGVALGFFVLDSINPIRAAGTADATIPQEVSPADAAKKYPPDKSGKYPDGFGTKDSSVAGFIQSPYSSRVYDCRKVKRGALILDTSVNKVFVRP